MEEIVDVSDMQLSNDPETTLVAYSVGAGVGVSIYDAVIKTGAMLHFMLPDSRIWNRFDDERHRFMFADTALPAFFEAVRNAGFDLHRSVMVVAGGSSFLGQNEFLNIGQANLAAFDAAMGATGLGPEKRYVGGWANRTLRLRIRDGQTFVNEAGLEET